MHTQAAEQCWASMHQLLSRINMCFRGSLTAAMGVAYNKHVMVPAVSMQVQQSHLSTRGLLWATQMPGAI